MLPINRKSSLLLTVALLSGLSLAVSSTARAAAGDEVAAPVERPITAAEYGTVLNLAGKQRMLSQRLSKEVMLIALEEDVEANVASLTATASLFGKTLQGLRHGDADLRLPPTFSGRVLKQLGKVEAIWAEFKPVLDAIIANPQVTDAQIEQVASANLPLLKEMNKCVGLYEKEAVKSGLEADPGLAVTLNLSGKQRMLTQKMSKEYLLIAYGYSVEDNQLNLLETYSLFERTLAGLLDGDETLDLPGTQDASIRAQLEVVRSLWNEFKPHMQLATSSSSDAITKDNVTVVAAMNLPLLKNMNTAVGMYEASAAK